MRKKITICLLLLICFCVAVWHISCRSERYISILFGGMSKSVKIIRHEGLPNIGAPGYLFFVLSIDEHDYNSFLLENNHVKYDYEQFENIYYEQYPEISQELYMDKTVLRRMLSMYSANFSNTDYGIGIHFKAAYVLDAANPYNSTSKVYIINIGNQGGKIILCIYL